jgi:CheY-like chemotaxis protein
VLIDIGLPGMDGFELAARLREARPPGDLRLIALTGYGLDSDRARSRAAGFDVHLVKPVDLDTLVGAIEPTAD